jgi:hypothetical protein
MVSDTRRADVHLESLAGQYVLDSADRVRRSPATTNSRWKLGSVEEIVYLAAPVVVAVCTG